MSILSYKQKKQNEPYKDTMYFIHTEYTIDLTLDLRQDPFARVHYLTFKTFI